jgi:hypothetical protein
MKEFILIVGLLFPQSAVAEELSTGQLYAF